MKFKTLFILTVIFSLTALSAVIFISKLIDELPPISNLESFKPSIVTKIYDKDGNIISELFIERRVLVPLKDTPADLQNAFIAIEDNDFYEHWGISTKGILRAFVINFLKGKVSQGGSTITQQLAKTIFLTSERTITRKIKEMLLTVQLEHEYTKEEILQLYINQIYFGAGGYGAESASKIYFGKSVKDINLAEAALIAGLPKAPNYYSPLKNLEIAKNRRAVVLSRMRDLGFITKEQEEEANNQTLPDKRQLPDRSSGHYFIEYLRILLEPKYGTNVLHKEGLSVYTTLDSKMQAAAEKALSESLDNFDTQQSEFFKKEQIDPKKVQGALIAIDPKTGAIRAMVGGRDFKETKFNRAIQAKRQAGSSFKPFLYTAAIDSKIMTPATILEDKPVVYAFDGKMWNIASRNTHYVEVLAEKMTSDELIDPMKIWTPANYGGKFRGEMTLRRAIAKSVNICAIETIEKVTPSKVIDYARMMGIKSPLVNSLSLALGSSDVTLQEMVSAIGTLASGGIQTEPYFITKIIDKDGKILENNIPNEKEVLTPQTSYIMTNLLKGVVERGSGIRARELGRPCAGKTGTSNDSIDAWFIGYTPQLAAGVWVGYDDRTSLGKNATGGNTACPIWTSFMKNALAGYPIRDFAQPKGIEWALIDPATGLLALSKTPGAYLESFLEGTAPTTYSIMKDSAKKSAEEEDDLINEDGF